MIEIVFKANAVVLFMQVPLQNNTAKRVRLFYQVFLLRQSYYTSLGKVCPWAQAQLSKG